MKVLFDIVHPADVLFFLNSIKKLQKDGASILILSREKDVTCNLLDQFQLQHYPVSTAETGLVGLAKELVIRDARVWSHARKFKPNVMIGLGGVAISHVGKLMNIPSVSFYAADNATLQTRMTWPFISHLYVPEVYEGSTPTSRTTRFPGVKEMSYFHPENFQEDLQTAIKNGLNPDEKNFFIRTVSWRANHDIGKTGWSDEVLTALVYKLAKLGKVHISSERELPDGLNQYAYSGSKNELHHLIAHCDLYVGESATMAHEACLLGTPAIYDGVDHPGTTKSLARQNLLTMLKQEGKEVLFSHVDALLLEGKQATQMRRDQYLQGKENLSNYIVEKIRHHAT